jgi:CRP-like cAMP-binding protein
MDYAVSADVRRNRPYLPIPHIHDASLRLSVPHEPTLSMKRNIRSQLLAPDIEPVHHRLSARQKSHLDLISSNQRLSAWTHIYERGEPAVWVYQVLEGVVSTFREMRTGRPHITGFLFERDLFGLAVNGLYASSARAVTRVKVRRAPADQLKALLQRDPELEFGMICKLTAAIRHAQRHTIAVGRRSPLERVAMFISMMEQAQVQIDQPPDVIDVPMSASDIADYLRLQVDALRRSFRELERRSIIVPEAPHRLHILDRDAFNRLLPDIGRELRT